MSRPKSKHSMITLTFYHAVDNIIPKIKGQYREREGKVEVWFTQDQYNDVMPLVNALNAELDLIEFELEVERTLSG